MLLTILAWNVCAAHTKTFQHLVAQDSFLFISGTNDLIVRSYEKLMGFDIGNVSKIHPPLIASLFSQSQILSCARYLLRRYTFSAITQTVSTSHQDIPVESCRRIYRRMQESVCHMYTPTSFQRNVPTRHQVVPLFMELHWSMYWD